MPMKNPPIPEISFGRKLSILPACRSRRRRWRFRFPGLHCRACSTATPTFPRTWRCALKRPLG